MRSRISLFPFLIFVHGFINFLSCISVSASVSRQAFLDKLGTVRYGAPLPSTNSGRRSAHSVPSR